MLGAVITPHAASSEPTEDFFDVLLREEKDFMGRLSTGQAMIVREFVEKAREFLKECGSKELSRISLSHLFSITTSDGKRIAFHLRAAPRDIRKAGGYAAVT